MKLGLNLSILDIDKIELSFLKEYNGLGIEFPIQMIEADSKWLNFFKSLKVLGVSGLLHKSRFLPESIFMDNNKFRQQTKHFDIKLKHTKELDCYAISVGIDPLTIFPKQESELIFIKRIRKCADFLLKYGIDLNIEYISPKIFQVDNNRKYYKFCSSLSEARSLISKVNKKNVKLLLDFLHWYADDEREDPSNFIHEIGFIHICDHWELKTTQILDSKRVLPYQGKLPLDDFIESLKHGCYEGPITIEVFRTSTYHPSIEEILESINRLKQKVRIYHT